MTGQAEGITRVVIVIAADLALEPNWSGVNQRCDGPAVVTRLRCLRYSGEGRRTPAGSETLVKKWALLPIDQST